MSTPRGPLFWTLVIAGGAVASCCLFSMGVVALGAVTSDTPATASPASAPSGGEWVVAGEVARGEAMNQALPGGRWVAQYGSIVNNVVARAGNTQWVQTNSSGSLYEFSFDDDGSYVFNWVSAITMYGQKSESHCTEKGTWMLSGTQLTLQPESQVAVYSNQSGSQEKTDTDLRERRFGVLDLTLETLSEPKRQLPGLLMWGPKADWDTNPSDQLKLTLQRLP